MAAQRRGNELRLYVQGKLVAQSAPFPAEDYDLSTEQPLRIGSGEQDFHSCSVGSEQACRGGIKARIALRISNGNPPQAASTACKSMSKDVSN